MLNVNAASNTTWRPCHHIFVCLQVPIACFILCMAWLEYNHTRHQQYNTLSLDAMLKNNPDKVAQSIELYRKGVASLSMARGWSLEHRVVSQEQAEAKLFMLNLVKSGYLEAIPKGKEECSAEGCYRLSFNLEAGELAGEGAVLRERGGGGTSAYVVKKLKSRLKFYKIVYRWLSIVSAW